MNSDQNKPEEKVEVPQENEGSFNEFSGIYFSSSIKIFDPNTEEVLVHKRGDN